MTPYELQVADALAACAVRGPTRFAWKGRLSPRIDPPVEAVMDAAARRRHLTASLSDRVRRSWYCHGHTIPAQPEGDGTIGTDLALLAKLSEANTGRGTWQSGWTVEHIEDGIAVSSRDGLRARVPIGNCRSADGAIEPGASVVVRMPKELPFYSPGFLHILGDAHLYDGSELIRVYWNVTIAGAAALVRALTSRLNAARLPFELKVATHPLALHRCDAAVLYLPVGRFPDARPTLIETARDAASSLQPRIPAMTLELAPGVGLAEDIRDAMSFGTHRCTLVAEAIVRAHERGLTRPAQRLAAVADRFSESGVAIEAPYRDPALAGRHVL